MATTSIRSATKTRLVALLKLQTELTGVEVLYSLTADTEHECVYLGGSVGNVTIPFMRSGRLTRDDTFTLQVEFQAAKPGQTAEEADQRVEEMYAGLENLLATNAKLALSGVPLDGVLHAVQDGPCNFDFPEATHEGFVGFATAQVTIKTRLS